MIIIIINHHKQDTEHNCSLPKSAYERIKFQDLPPTSQVHFGKRPKHSSHGGIFPIDAVDNEERPRPTVPDFLVSFVGVNVLES